MVNAGIIVHSFLLLRLGKVYDFKFEVKFYPPDPTVLNDDIARHLIYLQVCQDLDSGKLVLFLNLRMNDYFFLIFSFTVIHWLFVSSCFLLLNI